MKTVKQIEHWVFPYGKIATIPAGTTVERANNLPEKDGKPQYWAKGWKGMTQEEKEWKIYGFLLTYNEVKGIN